MGGDTFSARKFCFFFCGTGGGGLRRIDGEDIGDAALQRLGEVVHEGEEGIGQDTHHLGAGGEVNPVFAAVFAYVAHDVALEGDAGRHHHHLHKRAFLTVAVRARILLRRHIHRRHLEAAHHGILCHSAHGAAQHDKENEYYLFHKDYQYLSANLAT
ncbi:MAG: hypothetical protein MRZ32_01355 [Bacteroidales bacterium]|nr:hypothetical protein [Bacteroidales bacterium]